MDPICFLDAWFFLFFFLLSDLSSVLLLTDPEAFLLISVSIMLSYSLDWFRVKSEFPELIYSITRDGSPII